MCLLIVKGSMNIFDIRAVLRLLIDRRHRLSVHRTLGSKQQLKQQPIQQLRLLALIVVTRKYVCDSIVGDTVA